ncbi:MAG: M13 family peptidase, partial [Flavobacterium sp.]|nr:M13 family peptidase [Flavobacterium sp.]
MTKTTTKKIICASILMSLSLTNAQTSAQKVPGINTSLMDINTKPSENFFRFVNGTWLDKTEIPADKNRWGSFDELRLNTDKDALVILNDAANNPKYKSNTDQGKAVNLFKSIMDTLNRNNQGIEPIRPYLSKIDKVKNIQDLQKLLIEMEPIGGIGFFGIGVGADEKNSNKNSVSIGPGRLGLPDKDYYVSDEKDSKEKREKYLLHVTKMMQFVEPPTEAKASADKILALEIAMSKPRLDRVERRDSRLQYNPMTIAELQKLTPAINWKNYFVTLGFNKLNTVIVTQPKYMKELQLILAANKIDEWKAYMKWCLLNGAASELTTNIDNTNFEFYGKTLTGSLKQRPREQRALQSVNGSVGEALGKLYVEKMFPAEAKQKAVDMIKNVIAAYKSRINNLAWMSPETKIKAIEKLNKITIKVGYPDKWRDYSTLVLKSPLEGGSFFSNDVNISKWQFKKDLAKLN